MVLPTEEKKKITSENTIQLLRAEVLPEIIKLSGKIDVTNTKLDGIEKSLVTTNSDVLLLRKTLYGNGEAEKVGLVAMALATKKWMDDRSAIEKAVFITFIAAIIGEIVGFTFIAIKLSALP